MPHIIARRTVQPRVMINLSIPTKFYDTIMKQKPEYLSRNAFLIRLIGKGMMQIIEDEDDPELQAMGEFFEKLEEGKSKRG